MTELSKEGQKVVQKLREKIEVIYEGDWDVTLKIPKFGIIGEKWEIKSSKKVDHLECAISQGMKYEIPNRQWNRDGDPVLIGLPVFKKVKKNTDKLEGEWKDGNMFNGKFRNVLPAGEYLVEARAHTRNAGEEVVVKGIIQVVKDKKDLKKVKIPKEEKHEYTFDKKEDVTVVTDEGKYTKVEGKSAKIEKLDESEDFNAW